MTRSTATVAVRCDGCGNPIQGSVAIRGGRVLCTECARPARGALDAVQAAQLTLASATNRPMRTQEAVDLCAMLGYLAAEVARFREVARRLTEAREKGNPVDLWRAIGELEQLSTMEVVR